ncbi:MAG: hypothetical protein LBU24_02340 [Methanocalculaceae archaeon]|jgi:ACT domain-containing protein|nr:hypothetical protein [Methanocalculaceae archaeon]
MMMIADATASSKPFGEMVQILDKIGEEIGIKIRCLREDIFTKMHCI